MWEISREAAWKPSSEESSGGEEEEFIHGFSPSSTSQWLKFVLTSGTYGTVSQLLLAAMRKQQSLLPPCKQAQARNMPCSLPGHIKPLCPQWPRVERRGLQYEKQSKEIIGLCPGGLAEGAALQWPSRRNDITARLPQKWSSRSFSIAIMQATSL